MIPPPTMTVVMSPLLARSFDLVEDDPARVLTDVSEARDVVREGDEPLLRDRARQDDLLGRECVERVEVLRWDPRQRQMVAVGHEVGREEQRLLSVAHADRLCPTRLPMVTVVTDPSQDLTDYVV